MHIHLPFALGLKVFLLAGLLNCGIWHIAGYVTKLTAKFQNAQVANPHSYTHARTKLDDEFMSWTVSGVYECRSCHA